MKNDDLSLYNFFALVMFGIACFVYAFKTDAAWISVDDHLKCSNGGAYSIKISNKDAGDMEIPEGYDCETFDEQGGKLVVNKDKQNNKSLLEQIKEQEKQDRINSKTNRIIYLQDAISNIDEMDDAAVKDTLEVLIEAYLNE